MHPVDHPRARFELNGWPVNPPGFHLPLPEGDLVYLQQHCLRKGCASSDMIRTSLGQRIGFAVGGE